MMSCPTKTLHARSGKLLKALAYMNPRLLGLLCSVSLPSNQLLSQAKDTLFFKNGSVVVGEIKKIKLGVITFDPDNANDITVQLRNLKSMAAITTVFRTETIDHGVYFGRVFPSTAAGYARLAGESDTAIIQLERISVLYPFHKTFAQRFSGAVGLGYSYTRSSNFGRLNYDGSLNYRARKEEMFLSISGIYDITDTSFSRDREDVSFKYNYYFSPYWFVSGILGYQRNLELSLLRRYQEGVGVGNKFVTSKHVYAWTRGGFVINQEQSTEEVSSGTLAELFGQVQLNVFRFEKPEVNLFFEQTIYYSLSQSGRFRNDGETSLSWEVFKDFDLTLSVNNNYDSKPPVEGSHKFDFSVVFGLYYSF